MNMHTRMFVPVVVLALSAVAPPVTAAPAELHIESPGFPPTTIDAAGVIHERWGEVSLRIHAPAEATKAEPVFTNESFPTVVIEHRAKTVLLTQTIYRAPIWPAGVDVMEAGFHNKGDEEAAAVVELALPPGVAAGDLLAVAGGQPVLALPEELKRAPREERAWGTTGGSTVLPGWAKPKGSCDPAFRNIRAGMGGVPIEYRFAVPAGAQRQVVLGFCESHWAEPGKRPLAIFVEGAAAAEIDPVQRWGRHGPGCLAFQAADRNADGRIQVIVAPHDAADDRNTILNVLWVFPSAVRLDLDAVRAGSLTPQAAYYVDVGGENDQLLYKPGPLRFTVELAPGESRELMFLLASPGGGPVPNQATTAWTSESLRKAASDVWAGQ